MLTNQPRSITIGASSTSGLLRPPDPPLRTSRNGVEFLLNFIEVLPLYLCLGHSMLLKFNEVLLFVEVLKPLCRLSLSKKFINSIHSFIHTYIPTLPTYARARHELLERCH